MKTYFLLACCLLLALTYPTPSFAQNTATANSPSIVVVRLYDDGSQIRLVVTRSPGQNEVLKFNGGSSDRSLTKTSEGYYQVFARLYGEGYALQSTFGASANSNDSYTTMLFVKARQ